MSSQSSGPGRNPVAIALCLFAVAFMMAIASAATAQAAFYDVVFCAGGNGSGNPVPGARPGFFDWGTDCGESPSYPSEGKHYLRLNENTGGAAGHNDEVSLSWYAPPHTSIVAGGGYTRMPESFNQGWRARFWGEDWGGGVHNILIQGVGIEGTGEFPWITKNTHPIFAAHLWPFGGWDDYKRFVFGLACVRPAGCDRSGINAVDANTFTLVVNDKADPHVSFVDGATVRGDWVRGYQALSWREADEGSGLRFSRLGADGGVFADGTIDYQANGGCRIGYRDGGREFGKGFQPCTPGPYQRWYGLETKRLSDGQHTLSICLQDYGQYKASTETCDRRTIRTDNTAPGKPASLTVTSANPERYLDRFGATFSLPPNQGSPVAKVHYDVVDAAGKVVVAQKTLSVTDPTSLPNVAGPQTAGDYRLRVWLEDQVGHVGPAALAPIPHDTTPPAAPQALSVTAPRTPRSQEGFDLRWRNIVDAGSPIALARYEVLNAGGGVVVPARTLSGENLERATDIETPPGSGTYSLRLWLIDAEGNVGAPVSAPLSYECVRSEVQGGVGLNAGFGEGGGEGEQIVPQGSGATIGGVLRGADGGLAGAPLCVVGRVITGGPREVLGIAVSGEDGRFQIAAPPGPSRTFEVLYRPGQRQISAAATLYTRVRPSFEVKSKLVRNGQYARFYGAIPGPNNDRVVVVLQVKQGKGWRVFRRYRTRDDGRYVLRYRFRRTTAPSAYVMRAQVRSTVGYPYLQGNSRQRTVSVLPLSGRR
jgi:hypothetical protein